MNIKEAFLNGMTAYKNNSGFSSCIYAPDTLLEYAFVKGYQHQKQKSLTESILEESYDDPEDFFLNYGWLPLTEAKGIYQGREVELNKPTKGDVKRSKVFVNSGEKVEHNGKQRIKAKKVNFGSEKGQHLRVRTQKAARKNFAARHNCADKKDKTKAGYWSCRAGSKYKSGNSYW